MRDPNDVIVFVALIVFFCVITICMTITENDAPCSQAQQEITDYPDPFLN